MTTKMHSIIELPIRRYVSLVIDREPKIGYVEIVAYEKISHAEYRLHYQIDLDVKRHGHVSGVDLLQAFALAIQVLDAHIERCHGQIDIQEQSH